MKITIAAALISTAVFGACIGGAVASAQPTITRNVHVTIGTPTGGKLYHCANVHHTHAGVQQFYRFGACLRGQ